MKVVIDTNVVISAVFFGGVPRRIVEEAMAGRVQVCATAAIVEEYNEVVAEMIERKQGRLRRDVLAPFIACLKLVEPVSSVAVCRDPDDDKFISCAVDAGAKYIVSGDKDLLVLGKYKDIEIVTAKEFGDSFIFQS